MIGILVAVLVAAAAYVLCLAVSLPSIVALVAAILVLIAGMPSGRYGSRGGGGGSPL
jgi:hypothetical protein